LTICDFVFWRNSSAMVIKPLFYALQCK
jgi:hypothetical protein